MRCGVTAHASSYVEKGELRGISDRSILDPFAAFFFNFLTAFFFSLLSVGGFSALLDMASLRGISSQGISRRRSPVGHDPQALWLPPEGALPLRRRSAPHFEEHVRANPGSRPIGDPLDFRLQTDRIAGWPRDPQNVG